ncbi:hypothetical protein QBC37DRAFT_382577 [Rhypophila decipiens]|uniref:Uncharacterized protein n=1 Tax=Rhypophila decipiens TaxID=261697 RepID=A0AAN6YHF3_9PEZI|nr:hypothetical protein QBC37DRAFT_382577 [Rhypophila decipiens]
MVSRYLFWAGFGVLARAWQLGIEMRPLFGKTGAWAYPVYATVGASFGYWLQGVDERQTAVLQQRKAAIMEKRARRAAAKAETGVAQSEGTPIMA